MVFAMSLPEMAKLSCGGNQRRHRHLTPGFSLCKPYPEGFHAASFRERRTNSKPVDAREERIGYLSSDPVVPEVNSG